MKKGTVLLCMAALSLFLSGCGFLNEPVSTTRPLTDEELAAIQAETELRENADDPDASSEDSEKSTGTHKTEAEDRSEIANMIQDAEELIEEALLDDAKTLLQALRSRNLTPQEKQEVDALQAILITISD